MKTKIVLLGLLVSGAVIYSFTKSEMVKPDNIATEFEEQKVTITTSALKKSATRILQEKVIETENKERAERVQALLALQSFDQMNETMHTALSGSLKKIGISDSSLDDYIKHFDFNHEMATEYEKLHRDDLYSLHEILNHPTSQRLESFEKESQNELTQYMQQGQLPSIDSSKKFIINEILDELNALEQSQKMVTSLLAGTFSTAILENNPKATSAEARAQARQYAEKVAVQQMPLIKTAFEIAYDKVDNQELEEYLHFMQKTDARRASEINMQVTEKVMNRFLNGFVSRLIKAKKSKAPSSTSI